MINDEEKSLITLAPGRGLDNLSFFEQRLPEVDDIKTYFVIEAPEIKAGLFAAGQYFLPLDSYSQVRGTCSQTCLTYLRIMNWRYRNSSTCILSTTFSSYHYQSYKKHAMLIKLPNGFPFRMICFIFNE